MYIFNQYYLAFVKKTRNVAKKMKDRSSIAKEVLASIRKNYNTFENSNSEYAEFFSSQFEKSIFDDLVTADDPKEWLEKHKSLHVFQNISLEKIGKLFKEHFIVHQFLLILHIFRDKDLSDEEQKTIVQKLKGLDDELLVVDKYKETVNKIIQLDIKNQAGFNMKDIEDTSIGKLAKDIVEDLNLDKIKESVKNNGDILSALGDPENGIGNLIGDVSSKMAKKIKSGELKQEDLLKDALNMGSKLPMFGGGSNKNQDNSMGGGLDMGNIMQMMQNMQGLQGMMGGKGPGDINKAMQSGKFKNMQKQMKQKERMKTKLNKKNQKQNDNDAKTDHHDNDDLVTKGLEQLSLSNKTKKQNDNDHLVTKGLEQLSLSDNNK